MKKALLFFAFVALTFTVKAQFENWPEAQALTDSLSYNSNPAILILESGTYMFYDKKADTNSPSMIYYRDIQNMEPEQGLLSNAVFEYRNPKIITISVGNTAVTPKKFLLYESNEAGNFDIYAMEIYDDATFGNTVRLTATDDNKEALYATESTATICWEANQDIYVAHLAYQSGSLFTDTLTVIDTGACMKPVCTNSMVAYEKMENGFSHLYYSKLDSLPFYWSNPMPVDTTGNSHSIGFIHSTFDYFPYENLYYEKSGNIYFYDTEQNSSLLFEFPPEQDSAVYQPDALYYFFPVRDEPFAFVTYTSNTNGNKDVFVYYGPDDWSPVNNLSANSLQNNHPRFFLGWKVTGGDYCTIYLLDIWETQTIDNGSYLNLSKTTLFLCGGVDEKGVKPQVIKASPNPFTTSTTIEFYQENRKPVSVIIRSLDGKTIFRFETEHPEYGWNSIVWQPNSILPKGFYTVAFRQGNKQNVIKLIKY